VTVDVPVDDGRCFACGPHNADGLHLVFAPDGVTGAHARVTLPPRLQGYRDVAQGGIVMMLLDEVMAHACRFAGERAMTASMQTRFRKPVPLGRELVLTATVVNQRRNVLFLEAAVALTDGTLLATGEGTFVSTGRLS
jgi:acyl-coenzyme A thioesterase PaaI-like protein